MWIDLSAHLRSEVAQGDAWAAERLLSRRLELVGVIMSTGEQYHAPEPGWFRLVFCVGEENLREGIRRLVSFLLCLGTLRDVVLTMKSQNNRSFKGVTWSSLPYSMVSLAYEGAILWMSTCVGISGLH